MLRGTWTSKWQELVKASRPYKSELTHCSLLSNSIFFAFSLQLDTKNIPGIPFHVFRDAVMKSRGMALFNHPAPVMTVMTADARLRVLSIMEQCQASPRPELKENGPAYGSTVLLASCTHSHSLLHSLSLSVCFFALISHFPLSFLFFLLPVFFSPSFNFSHLF